MNSTAIHIENLSVYYGDIPAISEINLNICEGEYLGIIGPNGGGKSTLLKAMLGLAPAAFGEIRIYGKSPDKSRGQIGYVPQTTNLDKRFPITLFEVVLTGRLKQGIAPFFQFDRRDRRFVSEILEKVGIEDLAGRRISDLSGGEFQKMLIARALTVNPKLLLLDEPTASVDAGSRSQIFSLLEELNKTMTIVLVTHDLMAISAQVHKLACMNRNLVYHGEPELTEGIVNSLYGCPVDLIAHGVPHRVLKQHEED